jgi:hypothetical protein
MYYFDKTVITIFFMQCWGAGTGVLGAETF